MNILIFWQEIRRALIKAIRAMDKDDPDRSDEIRNAGVMIIRAIEKRFGIEGRFATEDPE